MFPTVQVGQLSTSTPLLPKVEPQPEKRHGHLSSHKAPWPRNSIREQTGKRRSVWDDGNPPDRYLPQSGRRRAVLSVRVAPRQAFNLIKNEAHLLRCHRIFVSDFNWIGFLFHSVSFLCAPVWRLCGGVCLASIPERTCVFPLVVVSGSFCAPSLLLGTLLCWLLDTVNLYRWAIPGELKKKLSCLVDPRLWMISMLNCFFYVKYKSYLLRTKFKTKYKFVPMKIESNFNAKPSEMPLLKSFEPGINISVYL